MLSRPAWTIAAAATFAVPTLAAADVVNGSFEAGYSGWTLAKDATSSTFATATTLRTGQQASVGGSLMDYIDHMSVDNYSTGLPMTGEATDGKWQAVLLQNGPSTTTLSQVVSMPEAGQLSFDLAYHNWDGAFSAQQALSVRVRDVDTGVLLGTVFQTGAGSPIELAMSHQVLDLSAFSSMTVRLEIEVAARNSFFDVQLDDIHIQAAAPSPGTHDCASCDDVKADAITIDAIALQEPGEEGGGCSTGRGGSPAMLALVGLLALRRRRR